jgi:AraC-like DNA-binding protein
VNPDLIFLHAGIMPRCRAKVSKHFEGYSLLQFVRRGEIEVCYDNVRHVLKAPAFWTCYPGPLIRIHSSSREPWHHCYIAMRGPGLAYLQLRGLFFQGVQACPPKAAARCGALMDRIIRLIHTPGPLSLLRAGNLVEQVLLDLAEWRHLKLRAEPWLEKLMSLLEDPDAPAPDYDALARQVGMALSTLRRRFRKHAGTPLHRYILELRMSKARQMAGNTDLPFKDIAERLGYDNPFYFSRQFHKFHGVPPGTYRRSRQT